jgi:hypothetical protein
MVVNNGENTQFWEDAWTGGLPLKLSFPKLYEYSRDKCCLVSECYDKGDWYMDFRRTLTQGEAIQWEALVRQLKEVRLNEGRDKMTWELEKTGVYSTKSMYRWLLHRGVSNGRMKKLWKSKLPMKLKMFMWLVSQDRIQSGVNLKRMHWKGDPRCVVCNRPESADHILFSCVLARFTWGCLGRAFGWNKTPKSLQDFLDGWLHMNDDEYKFKLFLFTMVLWVLWITRNKMVLEGVFPSDPADVLFKIYTFLQKWKPRLRCSDVEKLDVLIVQVHGWIMGFLEERRRRPTKDVFC